MHSIKAERQYSCFTISLCGWKTLIHHHMSLFGGIAQGHVYITVWCTIASALAVSMLMNRRREKNNTRNEVYKRLTHTGTIPEETHMKVMDLRILNTIKLLQSISWSITLFIRTLMFFVLCLICGMFVVPWFSPKSITYCKLKMMVAYMHNALLLFYTVIIFINI